MGSHTAVCAEAGGGLMQGMGFSACACPQKVHAASHRAIRVANSDLIAGTGCPDDACDFRHSRCRTAGRLDWCQRPDLWRMKTRLWSVGYSAGEA